MISSAAAPQPALAGLDRPKTGVVNPSPVGGSREFVLTGTMRPGEPVAAVFRRLAADLRERRAEMLSLMLYGSLARQEEIGRAMCEELGETNWPVTWVEGASCDGAALAGVQAFALSGGPITRIHLGGRVVGSVFEDGGARHCLLGGIGPVVTGMHPPAQVQQMFANLEVALEFGGFTLADVARTWFYNEDIVSWYGEFNRVRSAHYAGVRWCTGSLPASTGIGAHNPNSAAVQVAVWAVRSLDGAVRCATEIASPLQCPAPAYGSAFSRAMEITSGGARRLLISGTASIDPDGRTAWVGDARKQVDLTMEVVAAILRSRGMGYGDVTRATAYYRHAADRRHFAAWLAGHDLRSMPVVDTHSVICRDDLLFEIELDAVRPSRSMD